MRAATTETLRARVTTIHFDVWVVWMLREWKVASSNIADLRIRELAG
jgi:hypothetical protein